MLTSIICTAFMIQAAQAALNLPDEKIQSAPPGETIVAVVNGKNITASDVQKVLWDWNAYEVAQELMSVVMVEDYATKQGVSVTAEEVAQYLEEVIGDLRAQVPEGRTFEEELRAQGSSMSRLLLRARVELLARKVVLKDLDPPQMRKISRLLIVARSDSEADIAEAKLRADTAVQRLRAGESWSDVVQSMSDDQQSKDVDGLIGWLMPRDLPESVRAAIADLSPGVFTDPIESMGTFGIFRLDADGPPRPAEIEEIEMMYLNRGLSQLYDRIRRESESENRVVPPIKG